jgi:hypothetical protein
MMQAFSKFDPPGVVYVFIGRKIGVALPHLSRMGPKLKNVKSQGIGT